MMLTETGESRVRGYLFILGRSLRSFLPADVVQDALREMESHIRERVDLADATPDERTALEGVLSAVGSPLRVAQAYAAEITVDEALSTGRLVPIARAIWHLASTTVLGFFASLWLFVGYALGVSLLVVAVLKPIFPENVGLFVGEGSFHLGFVASPDLVHAGARVHGGYWIIPICILAGLGVLVGTHRLARRFLSWWQSRRQSWRGEP